jgi:hypothetical protein
MAISASALYRARRAAEADMRESCTATFDTGRMVWDDVAMQDVPEVAELYSGECELKWSEQVVHTRDGLTVEGFVVKIPVESALRVGAAVKITASDFDAELIGHTFIVEALAGGSHIAARRYRVREVTGPDGT